MILDLLPTLFILQIVHSIKNFTNRPYNAISVKYFITFNPCNVNFAVRNLNYFILIVQKIHHLQSVLVQVMSVITLSIYNGKMGEI